MSAVPLLEDGLYVNRAWLFILMTSFTDRYQDILYT